MFNIYISVSKNSEKMCGLKESSDLSNVVINSNLTYHYENVYQNENNKISNFSGTHYFKNNYYIWLLGVTL